MVNTVGTPEAEIERLLNSYTLRSCEALRRLLAYLAHKSLKGEAEQLKEYTIGVDGLGKPPSFDPRQDAIVRLQVGRLRQKLEEYYRTEGQNDSVVIELPKGHYKLSWKLRSVPEQASLDHVTVASQESDSGWRHVAIALAGALLITLIWVGYLTLRAWHTRSDSKGSSLWNAELEQIWSPFLKSGHALTIAICDPLFVGLQGTGAMFRTRSLNRWQDAAPSPEISALQKVLGNPKIIFTFAYTGIGEANGTFLLGRLLGPREERITLAPTSEVSWHEATYSNMVLIGPSRVLSESPLSTQADMEFVEDSTGIRNLHPRPGEQSSFTDPWPQNYVSDGEVFALITMSPGPFNKTSVLSFISNRTWGRFGAVRAFTDPGLARVLVAKLRKPSGEIPRSYQIVLRVEFRDGTPTNVSYIAHRELAIRQHVTSGE